MIYISKKNIYRFLEKKLGVAKYLFVLSSFIVEFSSKRTTYLFIKKMFMKHNFTLNHLTKFIYRETTAAESIAISKALSEDWELFEAYEEMKKSYMQLPKATFNPSPSTIQNILKYSQETAVETQH